MTDPKMRDDKATPPMRPYDGADTKETPEPVETDAPRSTDENGREVSLPDLGGKID